MLSRPQLALAIISGRGVSRLCRLGAGPAEGGAGRGGQAGASVKGGMRPSPGTARELPRTKSDRALRARRDSSPGHGGRGATDLEPPARPPASQPEVEAMPALPHE